MINDTTGRPSTPSLFAEALSQLTRLFETEIRLVRVELGEKISAAIKAIVILVASAVLMIAALIFILQGVVELLVYFGMQPFAASFLVGIAIAVIAGIAVWLALKALSVDHLKPSRTMSQLGKDALVIKDQVT